MKPFELTGKFVDRHIGPSTEDVKEMLNIIGAESLDSFIDQTIPGDIRLPEEMKLEPAISEHEFLDELRSIAKKNKIYKSYIGMGYYPTVTPMVIQRNILENPGWYTAYTPYQAEISQGRLEALLIFQTMVSDLTAMPLANSSLLDEGTAAAEAMAMFHALRKRDKKKSNTFFVDENSFPQTIDVLKTRAYSLGIDLKIGKLEELELTDDIYAIMVQYPNGYGAVEDYSELFEKAEEKGIFKLVAADLLSLAILKAPGEFGADAVVGSSQRFGVGMGYGGPHAGYLATREEYKRMVPGRIIGISIDSNGKPALRMALQTREQHIKRERATSNICTAQVLLAVMAGMYGVYHGSDGIKRIATRINSLSTILANKLTELGVKQNNKFYFDTLEIELNSNEELEKIREVALRNQINFRYISEVKIGVSLGETTTLEDIKEITAVFAEALSKEIPSFEVIEELPASYPKELARESKYMTHPCFSSYHSETELMRYLKKLENRDLSLTGSMIPLGSCTMKLNAATEMVGITWPEFASLHPFIPRDQAEGYTELISKLEEQLCEITGFAGMSMQPNSGAQGEYTGLMVIKRFHDHNGDSHRNIVIIPSSAHGTNPASAVMAGNKIVVVKCDEKGNIDVDDLREKAIQHKDNLNSLMITYPSTHGVFESKVVEICNIIHENGGQVYMDGANMNAQVGLTNPGFIGADVCHLNLHKTFAIPHGGGGPGVGPIGVAKHLVPFLPSHSVVDIYENNMSAVSSAPWGSASIQVITYAYIRMMGAKGLAEATKMAILNTNYLKARLSDHYCALYTGETGNVGHEIIFDMRGFKAVSGVDVDDITKRLMDYGFHAPTVSFPVHGTLMVEPTESESKEELDRFCEAMISIRKEIEAIENGTFDKEDNPLKNAPHTSEVVISDEWKHKYSRELAAFPVESLRDRKFWPFVGRIDNGYGDRNLICCCPEVE